MIMSSGVTIIAPDLTIVAAPIGTWTQGDTNKELQITVTNSAGASATTAVITVTSNAAPNGTTLASISGTGWTGDVPNRRGSTSVILQPSQSSVVSFFYNIASSSTSVTFTGSVATAGEVNTGNNTYYCPVTVFQLPDL
jgi:hypothetical protein